MSDKQRFSKYKEQLRQGFPTWSKIRKDPNAIGSQFLGVIGLQLDDVEWMLNYAEEQYYLPTADISQVDIIYKATIPNDLRSDMNLQFTSGTYILQPTESIFEFLKSVKQSKYGSIQKDNTYYIDFETKQIYVHEKYGGSVDLIILDDQRNELYKEELFLTSHHVWNFFDEFGLLLNLPRLPEEKNVDYKRRLLDVFKRPASAAYRGLMNGIARELGLLYEVKWTDGNTPITLLHRRVDVTSVLVDGEPYDPEKFGLDRSGRVILHGMPSYDKVSRKVSYYAGIELHELHGKSNTAFQNELFRVDGSVTPLLKYYVDTISDRVPIKWGQWRWNQGFWDVASIEMSGYGYIPGFYDAKISGWKGYVPKEG